MICRMIRSDNKWSSVLLQNGVINGETVEVIGKSFNSPRNGSTHRPMHGLVRVVPTDLMLTQLIECRTKSNHSCKQQIASFNVELSSHQRNGPV